MPSDGRGRTEDVSRALISLCFSLSLHFLVIGCVHSIKLSNGGGAQEGVEGDRARYLNVSLVINPTINELPGASLIHQPHPIVAQELVTGDKAPLPSRASSMPRQEALDQPRLPAQFAGPAVTDLTGPASSHYFSTDRLDVKPELIQLPEPISRRLETREQLDVLFYISASGEVDRAELLGMSNGLESQLIEESIQFAGQYFSPGRLAGKGVAVKMLIRFNAVDSSIQSNLAGHAQGLRQDTNVPPRMIK